MKGKAGKAAAFPGFCKIEDGGSGMVVLPA